jgi:hypothetical protein
VPVNFLNDPNVGPISKQRKKKRVEARSLTHSISGVGRCVGTLGWDEDELTSESLRWDQPTQPKKEGD